MLAIFLLSLAPSPTEAARPSLRRVLSQEATRVAESATVLSRRVGNKLVDWVAGYFVGEAIAGAIDETSRSSRRGELDRMEEELDRGIGQVVREMERHGGDDRERLERALDFLRSEIALVRQAREAQAEQLREIERRQWTLLARIDDLERDLSDIKVRLGSIEDQLSSVEDRLSDLERDRIRDCLDLVEARRLGIDGYPVSERHEDLREGEGQVVGVDAWARLYLDSCSPDLVQRGILIQSSLVTRNVGEDLSMWVTVSSPSSGASRRFEYFLGTPLAPVDGQVREFFLPYDDLPVSPTAGRTAVAVVLTLGGKVVYQLPPRAFTCSPGARIDCAWR